jgi:hypothetical protein
MNDLDEGCICGEEHRIWVPYGDGPTDEEFEAMTEEEYSVHWDKRPWYCASCGYDVTHLIRKE